MKRWVIKAGSRLVVGGGPIMLRTWMEQVVKLRREHDIEVIWVSSGAIASAVNRTAFTKTKTDWQLFEKQALSAIGQPLLMDHYNLALQATGLLGAQVLLTAADLKNKTGRKNFQNTVEQLLKWQVLPILNENDAVATEEIKFGDNDTLSAQVAMFTKADRLVILTDAGGLYDRDPSLNSNAQLIKEVKAVTPKIISLAGKASATSMGSGGMISKIRAAKLATSHGIETILIKGDTSSSLTDVARGQFQGTLICGKKKK